MKKTNFKLKTKVLNQAISFTALLLVFGFLFTGCPQKVKEEPKPVYYTVTLVSDGGTLTANPEIQGGKALKDSKIIFTASPENAETHEVDKWEVTGEQILEGGEAGSSSVKVKITRDTTVKVTFKEKPKYTVTIMPPSGGSLIPESDISQPVYKGTVINFTARPADPSTHEVDKWEVTGGQIVSGGEEGSTSVKVKITRDTTVKVTFKEKPKYTVTITETPNGTVTAESDISQPVYKGTVINFTASPANPLTHEVDKWEVTGGQIVSGGEEGSTSVKVKIMANTIVKVTFPPIDKPYTVGSIEFTMKGIAAVDASLGHDDYGNNKPHTVSLSDYLIGETEVTQELWQAVMDNNPSWFDGSSGKEPAAGETQGKRPVESANWYHAIAFCNKLSIKLGLEPCYTVNVGGTPVDFANLSFDQIPTTDNTDWNKAELDMNKKGFRLPTEAEWEWAAKGGKEYQWAGTNTEAGLKNYAWYRSNSGSKTHEVKKKSPNGYGLYDMTGNTWEWCWDWYGSLPASLGADYAGPASGSYRVLRGGSWGNYKQYCTVSYRFNYKPHLRYYHLGFRLACRP